MANGLIVPKGVALARNASRAAASAVASQVSLQEEIEAPVPEGHPKAIFWRVVTVPVGLPKATKGGLLLSDKLTDEMIWAHGLHKVVDVGSAAFKGGAWENVAERDIPKVGDLVLVNPRGPARVMRGGIWFFVMNDDAIQAKVDPEHADGYVFLDGVEI